MGTRVGRAWHRLINGFHRLRVAKEGAASPSPCANPQGKSHLKERWGAWASYIARSPLIDSISMRKNAVSIDTSLVCERLSALLSSVLRPTQFQVRSSHYYAKPVRPIYYFVGLRQILGFSRIHSILFPKVEKM